VCLCGCLLCTCVCGDVRVSGIVLCLCVHVCASSACCALLYMVSYVCEGLCCVVPPIFPALVLGEQEKEGVVPLYVAAAEVVGRLGTAQNSVGVANLALLATYRDLLRGSSGPCDRGRFNVDASSVASDEAITALQVRPLFSCVCVCVWSWLCTHFAVVQPCRGVPLVQPRAMIEFTRFAAVGSFGLRPRLRQTTFVAALRVAVAEVPAKRCRRTR
jgi:hypothetical protein